MYTRLIAPKEAAKKFLGFYTKEQKAKLKRAMDSGYTFSDEISKIYNVDNAEFIASIKEVLNDEQQFLQ